MHEIRWQYYPQAAAHPQARHWLEIEAKLGRAPNTIAAYACDLNDYLAFCARAGVPVLTATRADIAAYVDDLAHRPTTRGVARYAAVGLANATLQRRTVVVRLFYGFLIDEGVRADRRNPAERGQFSPGRGFGGVRPRRLLPHYERLPWIPGDDDWAALLRVVAAESLRNRTMFALCYDGALRRSELVAVETRDLALPHRQVTLRPEITKNGRGRVVLYGAVTAELLRRYFDRRAAAAIRGGVLFRSESRRNWAQPLSVHAWDKVVQRLGRAAGLPRLSTHTLRHLRLTDLARGRTDLHTIATYAGHRSLETTKLYIRLSGADLAERVRATMERLDARFSILLQEGQP